MNFSRKSQNAENILLVDGLTRTGKFFLSKIVSEFEDVEFFQYLHILEQIPYIYELGGIDEDAAVALIKSSINYGIYNQSLGRGLNHRVSDRSSIYNSTESELYLKRQFEQFNEKEILQFIRDREKKFLFATHNVLSNIDIFLTAYPSLNLIQIVRNPVDLVFSWHKKKYGDLSSKNGLNLDVYIEKYGKNVPWYHQKWNKSDFGMSEIDTVIYSIKTLLELTLQKYLSLSNTTKNRMLLVKYEDLIMKPSHEANRIGSFLKAPVSSQVEEILKKEGLPNLEIMKEYSKRSEFVYKSASDKFSKILKDMEDDYFSGNTYSGFTTL